MTVPITALAGGCETDQDGLPTLFDRGNGVLAAGTPMYLITGKLPTPQGEIGIATIRTTTCTLTVALDRKTAGDWAAIFAEMRDALADSGRLVVAARGMTR